MTKEEAVKRINDVLKEVREGGFAFEPVLRTQPNALMADFSLRTLTVEELPKKEGEVPSVEKEEKNAVEAL